MARSIHPDALPNYWWRITAWREHKPYNCDSAPSIDLREMLRHQYGEELYCGAYTDPRTGDLYLLFDDRFSARTPVKCQRSGGTFEPKDAPFEAFFGQETWAKMKEERKAWYFKPAVFKDDYGRITHACIPRAQRDVRLSKADVGRV